MKYYKVLSCDEGVESTWLEEEFKSGRLRVGWGWPGSDLRQLEKKPDADCTEDELLAWRKTQFLIRRIQARDRVVCQFRTPLVEFWVGEVTAEGYEFDSKELADFNHILNIKPLTPMAIPVNAKFIPYSLRHDLSKRNNYYEIYPRRSIEILDELISKTPWLTEDLQQTRERADEFAEAYNTTVRGTVELIRNSWPAKHFETLCAELLGHKDFVEVQREQDEHKGWDLLVRLLDPVSGDVLKDSVPVQCKNYEGVVDTDEPINDLERSVRNLQPECDFAYLFILGQLSDDFRQQLDQKAEQLARELNKPITFRVVDEQAIASLYLTSVPGRLS